jgi:hypothetical protein
VTGIQPFDPGSLLLIAVLNPAVVIVAFLMGRAADQPQKIVVAAFAAALAGAILIWVATYLRIIPVRGSGAEAGLLLLDMVFGLIWASIGYYFRPGRK